jgi:Zn-dependent M28 family amino/carboxypeptidase
MLEAGQTVRARIEIETEFWEGRPRNVVAEVPGTGPHADEIVILCAHLDAWHLGEGALDNGTGSAAILEAARALRAVDWQPRRTVRFVWFMGEEFGLRGSRAYVAAHADELDRIVAVVNSDMPGRPRRLVAFHHDTLTPLMEAVCTDFPGFEMGHAVSDSRGMWSDHAPFMRQGVGTLMVSGDMGPDVKYYHTTGDTYEAVDRPATVQAAAVYAVLIRRLADRPEPPTTRQAPWPEDES